MSSNITIITLLCAVLGGLNVYGQTSKNITPPGGVSILPEEGMAAFKVGGSARAQAKVKRVSVKGRPFSSALNIQNFAEPSMDYQMMASARNAVAVRKGDVMLAVVYARALKTGDEMGEASCRLFFQKAVNPWTKSCSVTLKLSSREWKKFYIPFRMKEGYKPGEAVLALAYGYKPQIIAVGGLDVLDYGQNVKLEDLPKTVIKYTYKGREKDAAWRAAAEKRIQKYRRGDMVIEVKDKNGKPLADTKVEVRMKRHAYLFGSAVKPYHILGKEEVYGKYREFIIDNFNIVTIENSFKPNLWEKSKTAPRSAKYNMENTFEAVKWLKSHDILIHGHFFLNCPLNYKFTPKEKGYDFERGDKGKMRDMIFAQGDERLEATKKYGFRDWDILNHPVARHGLNSRCWDSVLGRQFYADLLKHVRKKYPDVLLYINEGSLLSGTSDKLIDQYEQVVKDIRAAGAPLDGIGMMSHFSAATLKGMDDVYRIIDRFAQYGVAIRSTELDVGANGDEELQADYYRDFMTMFFSHPATDGMIMWGFWEGGHWRPETALVAKPWRLKPCGRAWLDLVKNKWWTDANGTTDKNGIYKIRGFYGDYEIIVNDGEKTKTVNVKHEKDNKYIIQM